MKSKWLIGGAVAGVLLAGIYLTRQHWWMHVADAKISCDGSDSPQSSLYRSLDGSVLVVVNHGSEHRLYVIETARGEIGVANSSAFFLFQRFAYARDLPPLLAPMAKMEAADPGLIVEEKRIEFTSFDKVRIYVTW